MASVKMQAWAPPSNKQADLTCFANGLYDVKAARVARASIRQKMAQYGTGWQLSRMVLVPTRHARKVFKA